MDCSMLHSDEPVFLSEGYTDRTPPSQNTALILSTPKPGRPRENPGPGNARTPACPADRQEPICRVATFCDGGIVVFALHIPLTALRRLTNTMTVVSVVGGCWADFNSPYVAARLSQLLGADASTCEM
ncbi:hypothetical protein ZHAS_00016445 [Anopheles sinensis]|uniref:Uncharacterized protein n=1 Tax=Anopheles sinensis TaxID=74873 RepID=A0A084WE17_ANOSI|nr:hypothetical protein ZHAS_00016445 [Anopheles sinensis]